MFSELLFDLKIVKTNFQWVNDGSGVLCQRTKGVTKVPIIGNQVLHIPVNYIREEHDSAHRKAAWLSGDGFGLLRKRGGKGINDQVSP